MCVMTAEIANHVTASQATMEAVALITQRICAHETKLLDEAVWLCVAVSAVKEIHSAFRRRRFWHWCVLAARLTAADAIDPSQRAEAARLASRRRSH